MNQQGYIHSVIRERMYECIANIEIDLGALIPEDDVEMVVTDFVENYFHFQNCRKTNYCTHCGRGGAA